MRLGELGEAAIVAEIRALGLARSDGVVHGVGDDAAVFRLDAGRVAVVTTDLLAEGVHFRVERSDPRRLGRRALVVNLSDIAAMGATPREAFLALAAPAAMPAELIRGFIAGFEHEARLHDVNLLGGDTCASRSGLVAAVTVVGQAGEGELVYRSGASAGDRLYVTGTLGDAAGGLAILDRGEVTTAGPRTRLVRAHELPRAHLAEGRALAALGASAMIDLSDGLLTDLRHVLAASGGLGATLAREDLPLSPELTVVAADLAVDASELALTGGEDYCLLIAVPATTAPGLEAAYGERFEEPLYHIGDVEAEPGVRMRSGDGIVEVDGRGFEHWRAR